MKKLLLIFSFFTTTFQLKAQTADSTQHSLEKEIKTYESKDITFIANARLIIAEAIKSNDFKKAKTTFKFITDKYDLSNYVPFASTERLILSLALEEYGVLLTDISRGLNNLSTNKGDKIVAYKNDGLLQIASAFVEKNKETLRKNIPNAERLKQEDKDLLVLMYKSFDVEGMQGNRASAVSQLNKDAEIFVQQYPESVYVPFVQHFIKEEYQESETGFIIDMAVNYFNFSSGLQKYFAVQNVGFSIGFQVPHKKWLFSMNANVIQGFTRTNEPLAVKEGAFWDKDIEGGIANIEFGVGYNVISSKRFRIYPYATFAYNSFIPIAKEGRDLSNYRANGTAIGAGAIIDYRFYIGKTKETAYMYNSLGRSILGIRVKGMYLGPNVPIKELSQPYSYINLGIYWEVRKMNRK